MWWAQLQRFMSGGCAFLVSRGAIEVVTGPDYARLRLPEDAVITFSARRAEVAAAIQRRAMEART